MMDDAWLRTAARILTLEALTLRLPRVRPAGERRVVLLALELARHRVPVHALEAGSGIGADVAVDADAAVQEQQDVAGWSDVADEGNAAAEDRRPLFCPDDG